MRSEKRRRLDLALAAVCASCPLCRQSRRKPDGLASRFVRRVEARFCPFCRAYARVKGHTYQADSV